jgi:hypothetical protein
MESEILRTTQQTQPMIQVKMRLKQGYILATADITFLNFFSPSLSHIAFLVHNFEFMIDTLLIKFNPESEVPDITSVQDFYQWLNKIKLYSNGLEFKYITDANNNYKQWESK